MQDRDHESQLQCIVEEGILLNRRDIVRVLRDLGLVRYVDMYDERVRTSGDGYVTSVVANYSSSTIIANRRLYLNVNNFEYMRLGVDGGQTVFDLVNRNRTIRLIPADTPVLERPPAAHEESFAGGRVTSLFGDSLAEVYFDDEEEEE
ncbi:MAG: hypothetical protein FJZ01_03280 [Candidatus Sericytochromatia bacterium]|nr:hypothetical protein [Candidatus Tanganyikabacteria bacterium]